jgi:hypothetical protein
VNPKLVVDPILHSSLSLGTGFESLEGGRERQRRRTSRNLAAKQFVDCEELTVRGEQSLGALSAKSILREENLNFSFPWENLLNRDENQGEGKEERNKPHDL